MKAKTKIKWASTAAIVVLFLCSTFLLSRLDSLSHLGSPPPPQSETSRQSETSQELSPPPPQPLPEAPTPTPLSSESLPLPSPLPPESSLPLPSPEDRLSAIDRILENLTLGNIAFNTPKKMNLRDTVVIQLMLGLGIPTDELKRMIKAVGEKEGARIRVSDRMEARLSAPNFDITAITPELQAVSLI